MVRSLETQTSPYIASIIVVQYTRTSGRSWFPLHADLREIMILKYWTRFALFGGDSCQYRTWSSFNDHQNCGLDGGKRLVGGKKLLNHKQGNSIKNCQGTTDPRVEFSLPNQLIISYHKFKDKSWSNFIFRISASFKAISFTKQQSVS